MNVSFHPAVLSSRDSPSAGSFTFASLPRFVDTVRTSEVTQDDVLGMIVADRRPEVF